MLGVSESAWLTFIAWRMLRSPRVILSLRMKKYSRRILIAISGLLFALIGAALTHSIAVQSSQPAIDNSAAFFLQTTATPSPDGEKDRSEIGSTDEIVVMGILIVLIVSVPIATRYKYWARHSTP